MAKFVDLMVSELSLSMDTHPSDDRTWKRHTENVGRRKQYKDSTKAEFYSLNKNEPYNSGKTSGWDAGPWPWQFIQALEGGQ